MFEKRKLKRIFLLYNIEKVIDTNVYNIVISFVRKMSSKMSIVVCVPSDLDLLEKNDWKKFCIDLYESENIKSYDLNEWKNENAIEYIKDSTADSNIIERADDIVKYFGLNPARLSAALDMIKKDKMMLSYICNNNFELSEFFDTKKLKSAFEFSIKKLSNIQCEIVYLMYLFEDGIEIKDISYILNVQNEIIINEIQKLPYLSMQQTSCYWKNNIYIDLIEGDESRFVSSYKHFEKHQHNTHVWAPLVNLSVLTTRLGDSEAERFTKEAYDFLVKHHLKQIKSAIINDINLPPKIVVAILMLFYNFEQLGYNSLEMLFKQINDERLLKLYDKYVKGCCFEDLFKGSAYNCDGKIMLKV